MPTRRTEYRIDEDGLPARVVGGWVTDKVQVVDRHAQIFATGMKNAWPTRAYIELFAGPGRSYNRRTREFLDGSAIRALQREFTHYCFVDLDPVAVGALKLRTQSIESTGRSINVLPPMDCNDAVGALHEAIPKRALTLAFVDPTNWQVRLDTIARLTADRHVDLLMTFHVGSMRRMGMVKDTTRLDAFFGTDAWRGMLNLPRWEVGDALRRLYNERLRALGYLDSGDAHKPILNSKGLTLYQLVAFSKHPRGLDFWSKALAAKPDQATIWG